MSKWPMHKKKHRTTQKHVERQDATDVENTYCFVTLVRCLILNYMAYTNCKRDAIVFLKVVGKYVFI